MALYLWERIHDIPTLLYSPLSGGHVMVAFLATKREISSLNHTLNHRLEQGVWVQRSGYISFFFCCHRKKSAGPFCCTSQKENFDTKSTFFG